MFDIGWSELLIVAIVALLVVGPKELPQLMRTIGAFLHKLKETASSFQRQFQNAIDESEVVELKNSIDELGQSLAPHEMMSSITGQNDFYDEFDEDEWDARVLMGDKKVTGQENDRPPNGGDEGQGGSAAPIEIGDQASSLDGASGTDVTGGTVAEGKNTDSDEADELLRRGDR